MSAASPVASSPALNHLPEYVKPVACLVADRLGPSRWVSFRKPCTHREFVTSHLMSTESTVRNECEPVGSPAMFMETRWSMVLAAGRDDAKGARALEELCRTYWLPLYSYVRREGYGPHDAQDLTQGFFTRLLRMSSLAGVSPEKGKFRTFLKVSLNHFLSDERDHARAGKRGGGQVIISLDETEDEQRYLQIPCADMAPEKVFDRRWALTVMELAFQRLRKEYESSGRQALFEALSPFLSSEVGAGGYDGVALKLGMSPGTVAVAVHRLRQRFRECVRLELAQTVSSNEDLDEELNYLLAALGGQMEP
jgi:RNA polymerase sigma factor (sigma-70 family)